MHPLLAAQESAIVILYLVIWIGLIFATVRVAATKGRSTVGWGIAAVFIGLIALIIVAVLPSRRAGVP